MLYNVWMKKKFYQSCCIDGVTYRLHDQALFPSSHGKLTPKLQSMWEDYKTGLKWVKVTKCYFPVDLAGNICHPCIYEVDEVRGFQTDSSCIGSVCSNLSIGTHYKAHIETALPCLPDTNSSLQTYEHESI